MQNKQISFGKTLIALDFDETLTQVSNSSKVAKVTM